MRFPTIYWILYCINAEIWTQFSYFLVYTYVQSRQQIIATKWNKNKNSWNLRFRFWILQVISTLQVQLIARTKTKPTLIFITGLLHKPQLTCGHGWGKNTVIKNTLKTGNAFYWPHMLFLSVWARYPPQKGGGDAPDTSRNVCARPVPAVLLATHS